VTPLESALVCSPRHTNPRAPLLGPSANESRGMIKFYDFIRLVVVTPLLMASGQIEVVGGEHLPSTRGFILASTHTSWFDSLWLARAVAPRRIHFMAKEELFRNLLIGWYLRMILAFPVNRSRLSTRIARHANSVLKSGEILGIFPTGTRRARINSLKPGLALFSILSRAPIVPVTRDVVSIGGRWRRLRPVHVISFGPPIFPETLTPTRDLKHAVELLNERVAKSLIELKIAVSIPAANSPSNRC
jgi:1-acyl-sn-glycerol-3-phosphate acyltransferase